MRTPSVLCPITGNVMIDPVIDPEGNSYERAAIMQWLETDQTSPITRTPLHPDQLSPNRALKDILENAATTEEKEEVDVVAVSPHDVSLSSHYRVDGTALVRVQVSDDPSRAHPPANIVVVVDVSYSMDSLAVIHGDSEGQAGLTVLDVCKHATRSVIQVLDPQDKLSVVAYANNASIVLPLTHMTDEGKVMAWDKVNALRTLGSTNLWDGLRLAMDSVRDEEGLSRPSSIILLTDGMPNINPPRGEVHTLLRYLETNTPKCNISTFGFGYSLQSAMLREIAEVGNGHYCFIPDSSFVGTVFVNTVANIITTAVPSSTLSIETAGEVIIEEVPVGLSSTKTTWGLSISLPPLIYGQTFDVRLKLDQLPEDGFSPIASHFRSEDSTDVLSTARLATKDEEADGYIMIADARHAIVKLITENMECNESDLERIQECLQGVLRLFENEASSAISAMKKDLTGQISEAYSKAAWFKKWGRHYLPSLARAHVLQQVNNFKDPGIQLYATKKFSLLRDEAEEAFCKLPPPVPSKRRTSSKQGSQPVSMAAWYNADNPCFARGSVLLANGDVLDVSAIRRGHVVFTEDGDKHVRCVVRTELTGDVYPLVALDDGKVLVTPWHPVRKQCGSPEWMFPHYLGRRRPTPCKYLYSFVLEQGGSHFCVGSYLAVSLGHGIEDDSVARHPFLGSEKVVENLSQLRGWDEGLICLDPNPSCRDPQSGLISSFVQSKVKNKSANRVCSRDQALCERKHEHGTRGGSENFYFPTDLVIGSFLKI